MEFKSIVWIAVFVGSTIGGLLPSLWGAGFLSFSSVIFTALGGFLGIWLAYKITR